MGRNTPAWIRREDRSLIPERAAVVRHIFDLAIEGHGVRDIHKTLVREKVPSFGPSGRWTASYIAKILGSRAVLGEYQPTTKEGGKTVPNGAPIADYYPAIVGDSTWAAAQDAKCIRLRIRGAKGRHINVFQGLLKDAVYGGSYISTHRTAKGGRLPRRILTNSHGREGRKPEASFPFDHFSRAIFDHLKSDELIPPDGDAAAYLAKTQKLLKLCEAAADKRPYLLQIRNLLRKFIEGIWLAIGAIEGGSDRLCIAQIRFVGSPTVWTLNIFYRRKEPDPMFLSWEKFQTCDLREQAQARKALEAFLFGPSPFPARRPRRG